MNSMEKFCFEVPGIDRKEDAVAYIREFYEVGSDINGTGGLNRYLDHYESWLEKLKEDYNRQPGEEKVPARTFFLVRVNDHKIIGMINIRLALNERLKQFGGNIGYSIRPTERGKGYNKINLYLGLKFCEQVLDAKFNGNCHMITEDEFDKIVSDMIPGEGKAGKAQTPGTQVKL